jgi:hypothetical protein
LIELSISLGEQENDFSSTERASIFPPLKDTQSHKFRIRTATKGTVSLLQYIHTVDGVLNNLLGRLVISVLDETLVQSGEFGMLQLDLGPLLQRLENVAKVALTKVLQTKTNGLFFTKLQNKKPSSQNIMLE